MFLGTIERVSWTSLSLLPIRLPPLQVTITEHVLLPISDARCWATVDPLCHVLRAQTCSLRVIGLYVYAHRSSVNESSMRVGSYRDRTYAYVQVNAYRMMHIVLVAGPSFSPEPCLFRLHDAPS